MSRAAPLSLAALATACSWGSLDGFTGGPAGSEDAGVIDAGAAEASANDAGEGGAALLRGPSCAVIKAGNPSAPDGRYVIEPPNGAPFEADCDMTEDGGGWMRVTEAMIEEKAQAVTAVHTTDENNRFMLRVYANSRGCGDNPPDSAYLALIKDTPRWTHVRARYDFYGRTSCWHALGSASDGAPFGPNLIEFEKTIDTARDMVKMGGSLGDAFDGDPSRCDDLETNFWAISSARGRRSLVAISRRNSPDVPAGLFTTTSCTEVADGAMSPTYWEHRDIYVR